MHDQMSLGWPLWVFVFVLKSRLFYLLLGEYRDSSAILLRHYLPDPFKIYHKPTRILCILSIVSISHHPIYR